MSFKKAYLSPLKTSVGPWRTLLASALSLINEDRQRANTDSPISVTGTPLSNAEIAIHLPVPFWPAASNDMLHR